ncbi:AAA domain-containing protein [Belliella sp. DSM 107340]|uniref:AAA domain-containing protein n=1 Tax=Belliella calami TaxID=2923436 RepID=A0ABS9UPD3_9BACT|nr:AAA domain-containing protein [Belliella calami]MCH7398259.1 AAA domain-containing protein [Belliella calami]
MIKNTFQVYLNRLTDLSSRNRSLYLPKLFSSQMIDLKSLEFLKHSDPYEYIRELIQGEKSIPLISTSDPRDKQLNHFSKNLQSIFQQVKTTEEETGEKSLYVAYPFVEGKLINDQIIRCPLLFFPVILAKEHDNWVLKRNASSQIIFNKTFILAYQRAYLAPAIKDENIFEEAPKEVTGFLSMIYDFLKENFSINFNQELYEQKLAGFPESSKSIDEEQLASGVLKLRPYAILGQFSQKSSFLIQDYEQLMAENESDLEDLLAARFAKEGESSSPREDQLYNVFPLDASQEAVVKAVRSGDSCVVEGPPGTGKSQLISNLAVDYISRGKKVLIVSQKRAALDVVYNRLEEKGFGAFLGLIHDFRTDRKLLFQKLKAQIDSIDHYQELNRGIDAIHYERQFSQLSRAIDTSLDYFDDYKKSLFNTEECGIPIKQLYMTSKLDDESIDLTQFYKSFTWDRVADFLRDLKEYEIYYKKYQNAKSFWLHRVDFSSFGVTASKRLKEILSEIESIKSDFDREFAGINGLNASFLFSIFEKKASLCKFKQYLHLLDRQIVFDDIIDQPSDVFDLLWLENKFETVKSLLSEEGVEWQIPDGEVQDTLSELLEYIESRKSWWGKINLKFNKNKYRRVIELIKTHHLKENDHDFSLLVKKLENRLNLNHQYTLLNQKDWLNLPQKPFDFSTFNHFSSTHLDAIQARFVMKDLEGLENAILSSDSSSKEVLSLINRIENFILKLESKIDSWSIYLSKIQIQHLISHPPEKSFLDQKEQIPHVFEELVEFDKLRKRLSVTDIQVMEKLLDEFPDHEYEQLSHLFLVGLSTSWIDHIESKYPVLREVGTAKFLNLHNDLIDAVEEKWSLSQHISELRIREQTFKKLEFNRLNNRTTYRELLHQVSKKKKLWSIKKLVENFEEEIFNLMPCWMASPETVSALFPLKQNFDLVIFDESSQCYVERGLPAMLRGKQVVIAGDSQQLQPFDLYQVRLDSDEEGLEVDTESLLDLSSSFFKKFWLKGHYRSSQKPLIEFSNHHFYQDKLEMLTERELVNANEIPFEFIHVDGIWENQVNAVEAETVIETVKKVQKTHPNYSVGVITFNFFQMELISKLAEMEESIDRSHLSIKNIENVQGDEFDWVIFSTGYAKNKAGRLIANFGMLSKNGGQNRLNVAITRAKRKISLITSLTSKDFKKEQLNNPGIEMLKKYLRFVEDISKGKSVEFEQNTSAGFEESWTLKNRLLSTSNGVNISSYDESSWLDLAVKKEGEGYVEAILTDDQRLYNTSSSKEAFVYHCMQLKQKSWPYHFYFSRQYWMGKDILEK